MPRKLTGFAVVWLLWLLVGPSQTAFPEDWPRWGGPRGDETWKAPKLPERWPEAGLPPVWSVPIGGGYGGVAVVADRVYVMDHVREPIEQERLLCFDARTGERLWTHAYEVQYGKLDYGNGPRGTPTVDREKVYTLGAVGRVCCVDAARGDLLWTKNFPKEYGANPPIPTWGLAASPLLWEDLVITHPGADGGGCLIAFHRDTGDEVWRASEDPAGYATPILIASPSGPLLVSWTPENVLGLNPRTGQIHWSIPYKVNYGVSIATPIYHDEILFVTGYWEGSKAIRLGKKPSDATLLWEENRFLRGLMAQPLYRKGHVYTLDKSHGLTCFQLATGKKLWDDKHQTTPRGRNPQATLVWLEDEDRAIILNELGELILARLNPQGYHERSRTRIIEPRERSPIWAHPAYAGSRVYARSDTELVCVELGAKKTAQ
ncbi:MAG: PQQ-binding-like beta-propeller repeat protein [Planctomycetales bacterium]